MSLLPFVLTTLQTTQSASGDASTIAQSVTGSTVNISLDSVPSSTTYSLLGYTTPYSAYSLHWMSAYHSWPGPSGGYQGWYPPNIPTSPQPVPQMTTPPVPHWQLHPNQCLQWQKDVCLYFIVGNISNCAGCGNKYSKPPALTYDLCIQHHEWRFYSIWRHPTVQVFTSVLPC